ncbi:hypothetical protein BC835DRAFT_171861 [Cytidiella melzeri]|nr:hypothetical protein BC835DRAFT_171861 [Cytidiella melzeri]
MAHLLKQRAIQVTKSGTPKSDLSYTRHIQLHNVPKSALPADIWRLCSRAKLENVETVDIDYQYLRPTGRAWLTLTDPSYTERTMRKFHDGIYIGASRLQPSKDARQSAEFLTRARGERGRMQAAGRGALGSGPSARVSGNEKNVALSGFPEYTQVEWVKDFLKSFKLSNTVGKEVLKMPMLTKESFNSCTRFLIRLASSSEAHRLVRKLHETDHEEASKDRKWRIKAHIIY